MLAIIQSGTKLIWGHAQSVRLCICFAFLRWAAGRGILRGTDLLSSKEHRGRPAPPTHQRFSSHLSSAPFASPELSKCLMGKIWGSQVSGVSSSCAQSLSFADATTLRQRSPSKAIFNPRLAPRIGRCPRGGNRWQLSSSLWNSFAPLEYKFA